MSKFKHFTLSERNTIVRLLNDSFSFKAIGRELNKDCTSISKEVKNRFKPPTLESLSIDQAVS